MPLRRLRRTSVMAPVSRPRPHGPGRTSPTMPTTPAAATTGDPATVGVPGPQLVLHSVESPCGRVFDYRVWGCSLDACGLAFETCEYCAVVSWQRWAVRSAK